MPNFAALRSAVFPLYFEKPPGVGGYPPPPSVRGSYLCLQLLNVYYTKCRLIRLLIDMTRQEIPSSKKITQ